ncbi:MAG: class I SAM-dependent DNA methyltransferase, partial [Thermomicrobiales bacterium]|nr:class I SAM-dependent DNA methyltransferase [Thermomicrobiales bacterium]
MNIPEFVTKWTNSTLTERAAAHSWFNDLCRVLDVPTPTDIDVDGATYTFERGATKTSGGNGWADVWMRGHFAWEFKGKHADLPRAYRQLRDYIDDLESPPLLVVSDFSTIVVRTNFNNTPTQKHIIPLAELGKPVNIDLLRALWDDPARLRPDAATLDVTTQAANELGKVALALRDRGVEPHRAAHFTVELLFCFFAEDIGLLPQGLFSQLLEFGSSHPDAFTAELEKLLLTMRDGGFYYLKTIPRFNGGLFEHVVVEPLSAGEIKALAGIGLLDWDEVEPAIFGTLFERSLDPSRRSQLGAHYTGVQDIERVIDPVVMQPLLRRWEAIRAEADPLAQTWAAARKDGTPQKRNAAEKAFRAVIDDFLTELRTVTVLDPACGSGNFLYVALRKLMDLEREVIEYAAAQGMTRMFPEVSPRQVLGLEINEYAVEITRTVVWIGFLQWRVMHGFGVGDPVLQPLDTIREQDALLDLSDPEHPKE